MYQNTEVLRHKIDAVAFTIRESNIFELQESCPSISRLILPLSRLQYDGNDHHYTTFSFDLILPSNRCYDEISP